MKKTIKVGIFGGYRGETYYKNLMANNAEIVAVCDFNEVYAKMAADELGGDVAIYTRFDDFIKHEGLEAVLLSNYFHEHAPYAIRALEMGIHVLSECTSNGTMAEGVALVRAAEKSKAIYMIAENYPYMLFNQEMRRVYQSGTLGKALFCEGEYNHPMSASTDMEYYISLCPSSKHWRYALPRTYYITHSLAPLMYITGAMPTRVRALPVLDPSEFDPNELARMYDTLADPEAFTVCLDLGHVALCRREPEDAIRIIGKERLGALHVHDVDYSSDLHTLPGTSKLKWDKICKALAEVDYQGSFNLEADNFFVGFPKCHYETVAKFMADTCKMFVNQIELIKKELK